MKDIYMDHASTTIILPEVWEVMDKCGRVAYGNPSTLYNYGIQSKKIVNQSRRIIANAVGAKPEEIFFCSGGSEADNWALKGTILFSGNKKKHIITTKIEHSAVLNTCKYLEERGFNVTYLDVDKHGKISLDRLKSSLREDTCLVSIIFANNEIGTIQPIKEIGQICKENNIYFHVDAVQAVGHVPINVNELNISMLSMSAHKFHGPKGIGALYIREGTKIDSLIHGGSQERGKRAGTENVMAIAGMAKALELGIDNMHENNFKTLKVRNYIVNQISEKIDRVRFNGFGDNYIAGIISVSFEGVDGSILAYLLSEDCIYVSTSSACNSNSIEPSHVLMAIGSSYDIARGTIRISVNETNTIDEAKYAVDNLKHHIDELRNNSKRNRSMARV